MREGEHEAEPMTEITEIVRNKWADEMQEVEKLSHWYEVTVAAGIEPPHFDFLLKLARECCAWRAFALLQDAMKREAGR